MSFRTFSNLKNLFILSLPFCNNKHTKKNTSRRFYELSAVF